MGTDALRLSGVSLSFGAGAERHRVLDQIDLSVRRGEFLVILGPSGSGKSTLLSVMAGLYAVEAGQVWRAPDLIHEPGIVFQEPLLLPWATVSENVALGLRYRRQRHDATPGAAASGLWRGRAARRRQVRALLGDLGIEHLCDRYPDELSGGQAQRVAIARTIVTAPSILLMDEPFGALDPSTRSDLQRWLLDLRAQRHLTVVFVTHDLSEANRLGDRILEMRGPNELRNPVGDVYPPRDAAPAHLGDLRREVAY